MTDEQSFWLFLTIGILVVVGITIILGIIFSKYSFKEVVEGIKEFVGIAKSIKKSNGGKKIKPAKVVK